MYKETAHNILLSVVTTGFESTLARPRPVEQPISGVTSVTYAFAHGGHMYEDGLYVGKKPVFVVADGVSRTKLPDGSYPNPSGAALAAQEFCDTTGAYLEGRYHLMFPDTIFQGAQAGNDAVADLNRRHGITPATTDYLVEDYFNACGAVGAIVNGHLKYLTIGDCGVAVFDSSDQLIFMSQNKVAPREAMREHKFPDKTDPKRMMYWRKELRNHPRAPYDTYGTITGEVDAESYFEEGTIPLLPGDQVLLYSDGFENFVKYPLFRILLRQKPSREVVERFITDTLAEGQVVNPGDDRTVIEVLVE